jgi:hypothetical protein
VIVGRGAGVVVVVLVGSVLCASRQKRGREAFRADPQRKVAGMKPTGISALSA